MTAPTINGTKFPQPVDVLLPAARALDLPAGQQLPSRNRLMREFRIGAAKADDILARLKAEHASRDRAETLRKALILRGSLVTPEADTADPAAPRLDYPEPIGPDLAPAPDVPESAPVLDPIPAAPAKITPGEQVEQVTPVSHPDTPTPTTPNPVPAAPVRSAVAWPVVLLALPAFVAIWSGWVGLGGLTGFGVVHPLPGIADGFSLNTAITLPIGVETYGAYALYVWLSGRVPPRALRFAKWSAIASLLVGALGQVAYHLLVAPATGAPWWITTAVSVLPVAVLGMGAALAHLVRAHD
ncbi:ABC transporter permease [Micromonospora rubida]|uniref:ABC transporter permease n=1 Tax=Micromonospora rubida TaxID=2697657 RepID=UPI0013780580|nr:ABC transporter permease [Micromonospora rubida]NBE82170.1 ABC transporter permease [Micromonospora rubida]